MLITLAGKTAKIVNLTQDLEMLGWWPGDSRPSKNDNEKYRCSVTLPCTLFLFFLWSSGFELTYHISQFIIHLKELVSWKILKTNKIAIQKNCEKKETYESKLLLT